MPEKPKKKLLTVGEPKEWLKQWPEEYTVYGYEGESDCIVVNGPGDEGGFIDTPQY